MIKSEFTFKSFSRMRPEDYAMIGFKAGLEVHQQLLTEKKLFCRCPAGQYSDAYDAEILRHMRPTLSEMGEYDGTALMEFKTKKNIIYRINHHTVCTYEMDDTPPFLINQKALDKAIAIGMFFGATVVDEMHIIRKQYLDGSIPTGFQRTAIFCINGSIPFGDKKIDVVQISIEEDSCREVFDKGHQRTWLTDRLGMPLVEIVTAPQMKTPHELAAVCQRIRIGTRNSRVVRTGAGASRQDVNVSIQGGTRIEIKGVPSIRAIPLLAYHEAMRQWNLLKLKDELKRRGITPRSFSCYDRDVTTALSNTSFKAIRKSIHKKGKVKCVVLKGFSGLLKWKTQSGTFFSKEISDRIRVIACLDDLPNMIHSDQRKGNISAYEWRKIRRMTESGKKDACILVWGDKNDVDTAVNEIIIRTKEATQGIPKETRQALEDGTTGFERILPGADRMYPDTDLPPMPIASERKKRIRSTVDATFWEREKRYKNAGVPDDVLIPLCASEKATLFEDLVYQKGLSAVLVSVALIQFPKRLKKMGFDTQVLTMNVMRKIFNLHLSGKLPKDGIFQAMYLCCKHRQFRKENMPVICNEKELELAVKKASKQLASMHIYNKGRKDEIMKALVITRLRGRINGKSLAGII